MFAIPPDQALALSLIKRAADLIVGVPGLIALQILEGGRLKATYSRAGESCNRRPYLAESDGYFFLRDRASSPRARTVSESSHWVPRVGLKSHQRRK
jgi:hypothetical protein